MADELVAIYADPGAAMDAVQALRSRGISNARVSSPAGFPVVEMADHRGDSRLQGWLAFLGGLTGLGCAAWLQVATSKSLGLMVGGKPIVAWTAFGVIMFELTMLFAGATNFVALIVLAALARRKMSRAVREQLSSDRIVVVVRLADLAPNLREAALGVLGDSRVETAS
jgi:Protein of unknown function (DUF3341)